jgi:hypothetical protein
MSINRREERRLAWTLVFCCLALLLSAVGQFGGSFASYEVRRVLLALAVVSNLASVWVAEYYAPNKTVTVSPMVTTIIVGAIIFGMPWLLAYLMVAIITALVASAVRP